MGNSKKLLCMLLSLIMVFSVFTVAAVPAGAYNFQGDLSETSSDDGVIYFDAASAGWSGASWISFYIYDLSSESEITYWGAKNKLYTDRDGDIWSFDAKGAGVQDGHVYEIIFANLDSYAQTAPLLFDSSCLGDMAYCDGTRQENEIDSAKTSLVARWKNSSLGPMKCITSIGNVVGETIPANTSAYEMFVDFLKNKLNNARDYSRMNDQKLIDYVAGALYLTKDEVYKAIIESGVSGIYWSEKKSNLAGGTQPSTETPGSDNGMIYFDAASAGWSGLSWISFYIYDLSNYETITEWGAKNKKYTDHDGDIWEFNAEEAGLLDGHVYEVIFLNLDTNAHTAPLLLDSSCSGDMAYCDGTTQENDTDSNKISLVARWKNSSLGPMKCITTTGNVVGETIPDTTSAYQMFVDFLARRWGYPSLMNTLNIIDKDAQTVIDDIAKALELDRNDVEKAIKEAAAIGASDGSGDKTDWSGKWDSSKSTLPGGAPEWDQYGYVLKDYYLTGSINGDNSGITAVHKELRFTATGNDDLKLGWVKLTAGDTVNVARYNGGNSFAVYPNSSEKAIVIDKTGFYDFYLKPYEMGNPNYWSITPTFVSEITHRSDTDTGVSVEVPGDIELVAEVADADQVAEIKETMPEGTEVLGVYDIYLTKNGNQIQPEGYITVKIPCSDRSAEVYRRETDGTLTSMNAVHTSGFMTFMTNHFSTYILAVPGRDGVTVSGSIKSYINESDVTVKLTGTDNNFTAETKGKSDYSIADVPEGEYTLTVSKANHVTREYTVTVADTDVTKDVEICPLGDVTGDGKTNVQDCTAILRYVRKLDMDLSDYQLKCADVTGDNKVNVQDVTKILRHVRKIEALY